MRAMAATLLVLALISTAQAAEPTRTLTLACTGKKTYQGGEENTSEQINLSIIVDFQKKSVMGLSDGPLATSDVDETTITLSGAATGWVMNGGIDRVTGSLYAVSIRSDPSTRQTILSTSYNLQCQSAQ
jgi:hypothetical protein